jgi:hypothetical protein
MEAAREFFRKAVAANRFRWPTTVNLDGNAASHRALRLLGEEDPKWKSVVVRCCRYLNNIVEQDHRAIKRRCASMLGLKSFRTAAITFAGVELAHRIRKRQYSIGSDGSDRQLSLKQRWDQALAPSPLVNSSGRQFFHEQPATHQNSAANGKSKYEPPHAEPRRCARKVVDGRGLYLLVMPNGGRYWRYDYRFQGKHKALALGIHPDVSREQARARHQVARTFLANGTDPSVRKRALGNSAFATLS